MKCTSVDFRELPGQNPLFLAYLEHSEKVRGLYPLPTPSENADRLKRRVEAVLAQERLPRHLLIESLKASYAQLGLDAPEDLLEKLGRPDTVAVVTGQQVGLFGGPALTVFKAATAVRAARYLSDLGLPAVPVFWLASNDSDFEEVRKTHFVNRSGELLDLEVPDLRPREEQMAGTVPLQSVAQCLDLLSSPEQGFDLTESVLKLLQETYSPTSDFRGAFGALLATLFRGEGLILFDPLSSLDGSRMTSFLAPVIERRDELVRASFERVEEIQGRGFAPQVKIGETETFLFWQDGKYRYKLDYQSGKFRVRGLPSIHFTGAELLKQIDSGEARVSPSALLRPVLQEYLFPAAYAVTGPAETSYYAQVGSLAEFWNLELSALPRSGFTLVDRRCQRLLEQYRLNPCDVMQPDSGSLLEKILLREEEGDTLEKMSETTDQVRGHLEHLRQHLSPQDHTIADMLENSERKILYQLQKVRNRFILNSTRRREDLARHVKNLENRLVPKGKSQERVINFSYFLSEGGPETIKTILEAIKPFCPAHRILHL
jgi:bacillithiol biosynthesis cysteine-adding enzyme BshC